MTNFYLTFEEVKNLFIIVGKLELKQDKWICRNHMLEKLIAKYHLLSYYFAYYTKDFPVDCSFWERVYHIMHDHQEYLNPKCPECGMKPEFVSLNVGYSNYCSYKCANISQEVKDKKAITLIETTGYSSPGASPQAKLKRKQTCLVKYNVDHPVKHASVMNKRIATNQIKYNCDHVFQNEEIKLKCINSKIKNGTAGGYSKISQKFFDELISLLPPEEIKEQSLYATKEREMFLRDIENKTFYLFDFTLPSLKLIIEFDGDYWHSKPEAKERDAQKQKFVENLGYTMIRVKEGEYIKNPHRILFSCLEKIYDIHERSNCDYSFF